VIISFLFSDSVYESGGRRGSATLVNAPNVLPVRLRKERPIVVREAISKNGRCNLFITMEGSFIFKWCRCSVSRGWAGWFDSPCLLSRLLLVASSLLSFYSNDAALTVTRQDTGEKVLSDNTGGTLNAAAP